jgi:tousled-like kinase
MISTNLQRQLKSLKSELESVRRETNIKTTKAMDVIEKLVRDESIREAKDLRQKLASDGARLGRLVSSRVGLRSHDHWEDGHDPLVLKQRKAELKMKREALERRREDLAKAQQAQSNSEVMSPESRSSQTALESESSNSQIDLALMNEFDRFEANETIKMHLDEVRREEAKVNEEERALQIEKQAHVRALKRVASEDSSKFRLRRKVSHIDCSCIETNLIFFIVSNFFPIRNLFA